MKKRVDWRHWLERSFIFFPLLQGILAAFSLFNLWLAPSFSGVFLCIASIYLFPLAAFRITELFFPLRRGVYPIGQEGISGWLLLLRIQTFLITFPVFERCLHLVPGLYSFWLRAWGSHIGKNVFWTPSVEVLDRPLLRVGDFATLGHQCTLSSHAISMVRGKHLLFCKEITIGSGALIGGKSVLGPGAKVGNNSQLNAGTHLYPNQSVPEGTIHDPRSK